MAVLRKRKNVYIFLKVKTKKLRKSFIYKGLKIIMYRTKKCISFRGYETFFIRVLTPRYEVLLVIYYAIYNAKDECCFVGTRDECIRWLGFSKDYFYYNISRTRNGIFQGKQGYRVYKIEEDENEEV